MPQGKDWRALCEQATKERNPEKLLELTREINRLLQEKEQSAKRPPLSAGRAIGDCTGKKSEVKPAGNGQGF